MEFWLPYVTVISFTIKKSQIPTTDANNHILESNLKMYNRVLNQAIRKAKRDYYQNMLTKYKHDLKKTWSTLNTLLCRNKKNKAYPDRSFHLSVPNSPLQFDKQQRMTTKST